MSEYDYARAQCPTCGTPGYAQDHSGFDGTDYATPNEAILRGTKVLEQGLADLVRHDIQHSYELVEEIFRAMLSEK